VLDSGENQHLFDLSYILCVVSVIRVIHLCCLFEIFIDRLISSSSSLSLFFLRQAVAIKKQHKITTIHTNMHSLSAAIGHVLFTCISM